MRDKFGRLAAALADAWQNHATIPLPAAVDAPTSRQEALAVQDRMAEIIGEPVVGWKVGAAVKAVQALEGHDGPIPGRLFASRTFMSPARAPAAAFAGYKIECEFAFRLSADVPARRRNHAHEEIEPLLVFHPGIELAGSRYRSGTGGRSPNTHDAIADNGSGGAFVFGPGIADWRGIDFERLPIDARMDGGEPIQVHVGEYRRNPVDVALETLNDLSARGIGLCAGDYLSTGSLTLPTPIHEGQELVARFGDLQTLSVRLV